MSRKRPRPNSMEHKMVRSLDALTEYDQFQQEVAPILRKAVLEGWSPEKIRSHPKIQAMLVARQITVALTDNDSSRALAAIKDNSDRAEGKPKERSEITHKMANAPDDQLDAKLKSLLSGTTAESDNEELPN